jgi:hypothetical protein
MMGRGMTGPGMMPPDEMGGGGDNAMMEPGMMGPIGRRGHMMKIMFAIADANGDGGLSFEEVTAINKRLFDQADGNKDGKVTREEIQAFLRD